MIVKTKGTEKIIFDTIELAAKDAKMGKNILKDVIKKKRLVNGWLYKEEEKVKPEVDKSFLFENLTLPIHEDPKVLGGMSTFPLPGYTPVSKLTPTTNLPVTIINTIPEDFFLTNIKKMTARRKKK